MRISASLAVAAVALSTSPARAAGDEPDQTIGPDGRPTDLPPDFAGTSGAPAVS